VTGAVLWLLQNSGRAHGLDHCNDVIGLVADDDNGSSCAQRQAGAENLFDKSSAPGAMKHFRTARLEACAFAGS
jgi:hypothetical protein